MATDSGTRIDPSADEVSNYDYQNDTVARSGLVDDLQSHVDGEVRFDEYSRQLYATDASLYEVLPIGVVYPRSTDDVAAVMSYCAQREIPVLPRGGGTSLAGQTVNEAVVLDFSRYMNDLFEARPDDRRARAQPGIKLGDLNGELADHGLKFAPDPAWGDKSVLGGAIGNNSTGAHSLQYGKTDAYIEECEVVLADGTVTTFGEVTREELRDRAAPDGDLEAQIYAEIERILTEEGEAIESHYPDLKRNVSGYNLDWVLDDAQDGTINVASLLAGSEGTLAIVTEAEVSLEPIPETKSMALLAYEGLIEAMEDVADILEHDPAAVEVLDDVLIDLARDTAEFEDVVGMLPDGTRAVLIVEFYADDEESGRRKVADLLADRTNGVDPVADPTGGRTVVDAPVRAFDAMEAHDEAKREKFWKMRKSGLPILLSRTTDEKHGSFIEDTAIPPENLPEYVADFREILEEHDTFASFYAHAGPGVLHIRPLINTKSVEGVETMESIADAVTDLVVKYGGSVSGEHGDGRARTQWNEKLYGADLWETFQELKSAFDPDWLLNPGQVVGVDAGEVESGAMPERARTVDMTENLRFSPEYEFDAGFDPALEWDNDNGMQGMVELCHGCGGCRGPQETTGGVMCPTYRASEEEMTTTRGRANMLRQAMSGDLPDDPTDEEFMHEVLDLCIGCKGCAKDCPSEVDMAKLKAEVTHAYHQEHGSSFRDKLFANVDALAGLGSAFAPLSNLATKVPGARTVLEKAVGIAPDRTLPSFQRTTLQDWFDDRGPQVPADEAERRALLFPDTYMNYSHPEVGKAAVRVLEAAGVHVQLADRTDSGRPAHSKGFLDQSRATARDNVDALAPAVEDGWDVVLVEPSDAVMFQSDYLDLLSGEDVETLAANAYGVCEYLDTFRLDEAADWDVAGETLTYHGHCHQKATKKDHHAVGVLRRAGYDVDPLDSGCCGMAGSFGYEAEHFSMSKAIGSILFDQIGASRGDTVVAPGASCRTQLDDWDESDGEPPHPVEKLDAALA
ncbi:FAD-binding and (Fe-S)-binding domain-containing protein [Haloarcula argentinensis]|uniref:D-lactate dehydrogenase (cytochrome) n=1 Tax=Haloarcula argentinensis TaxID=43776 RepID=A0ABU2F3B8_HALAR|nr:FAD-binding and (Fe-S)-binding domain-containing protein [Haloarcula argentinensis]EMA20062.1 oxidoreductase [Haloarcula argentinensis DSM 12282]MDS0254655.1 FAD-binding protein [Haloarcula argentinensis]